MMTSSSSSSTIMSTSLRTDSALTEETSLPRLRLDSMADYEFIAKTWIDGLLMPTVDEQHDIIEHYKSNYSSNTSSTTTTTTSNNMDDNETLRLITHVTKHIIGDQVLDQVKRNIAIDGVPFDHGLKMEPPSLELHTKLCQLRQQRDSLLKSTIAMRSSRPENTRCMIEDSLRIEGDIIAKRVQFPNDMTTTIDVPEFNPGLSAQIAYQGSRIAKDLVEAIEQLPHDIITPSR